REARRPRRHVQRRPRGHMGGRASARPGVVGLRRPDAHALRRDRHADAAGAPDDRAPRRVRLRRAFAGRPPDVRPAVPTGRRRRDHYVVRSVNMRTGRLEPGAIVDKTEPDEQMNGVAMYRAWSPDRTWAYTLYNGGSSHAFIHALNTRN